MTYPEALQFLDSFQNYEKTTAYAYPAAFSLGRVERLLARLGDPHLRYPTLHVAGTKGKGSVCAFSASILSAAGLKTGLYTSPHLFSFRERIRVDGRPLSGQELAAAAERLRPSAGPELTYFEVATACAFLYFAQAGVQAAVVEVGMGGRLDATNLLRPEVSAITPVSLDHLPQLGSTLEEIAAEKAGILKKGVPAVIAPQAAAAMRVIEQAAARAGAPLHPVEAEVRIERPQVALSGGCATLRTPCAAYGDLEVPLLGRHQLANAAAAVRMAELLAARRPELGITEQAIRRGIAAARWPGRCQLIPGKPPLLLDGAQNAESARAFKESVEELFPGRPVALVAGASREKDLAGMAAVWGPWARKIFLVQSASPRSEPLERLRQAFARFSPKATPSVEEGMRWASRSVGRTGVVAVSGSLFVVAEALRALGVSLAAQEEEGGPQEAGQERDRRAEQGEGEGLLRPHPHTA